MYNKQHECIESTSQHAGPGSDLSTRRCLIDGNQARNMTQGYTKNGDAPFNAAYDTENRLTSLQYTDSGGVLQRYEYAYSGDDLLAIERHYENGTLVNETRIVRDGMLAIQDRNGSNVPVNEYTWGLNLGGGIGGLLNLNTAGQNYAYLYDGKGNVEAVLDNTQAVVTAYRYDPFGKLLNQTGSLTQPYGFSTKRYNAPVGMVQYEYRSYLPEPGRWLTRDPLGEAGGMNLYAFVGNNPVNWVDPWGLLTQAQRQAIIANWMTVGSGIGAMLGFMGGGGFLTGPGAVAAVPAGAWTGAATGAGIGGTVGAAIGGFCVSMMDDEDDWKEPVRRKPKGKTPRNNKAQNKQFNDAVKKIERELGRKLSKSQRNRLHQEITKQGYGYDDIVEIGLSMFQ
jgi:RHS repeat-associated protein